MYPNMYGVYVVHACLDPILNGLARGHSEKFPGQMGSRCKDSRTA